MSISLTAEAGSLETKKKVSNSNFGPFSRTETPNVPSQTHFTSHFHTKPAQSPLPKFVIFLLSTAAKAREPICSGSRSEQIEVKSKAEFGSDEDVNVSSDLCGRSGRLGHTGT